MPTTSDVAIRDGLVDPADFTARALVGRDTGRYRLGAGVNDPASPTPLDSDGESECSSYLLWLWRCHKRLPAGWTMAGYGSVNTTALYHEARGTKGGKRELVVEVGPGGDVQVGDALVYPGVTVAGVRVKIGHCGGVVGIPAGWRYADTASLGLLRVSHCNAGAPPAIDETNGRGFAAKGAIVVRLRRRW